MARVTLVAFLTLLTASVVAQTQCDLFVLNRNEFSKILRDHHQLAETVTKVAKERYDLVVSHEQLTGVS